MGELTGANASELLIDLNSSQKGGRQHSSSFRMQSNRQQMMSTDGAGENSPPTMQMMSPPMPVIGIEDEDDDDKGTDGMGSTELQGSTIALNIRFNDKSIPQNYRNSIFNYSPHEKINNHASDGQKGLFNSTDQVNLAETKRTLGYVRAN